jgi:hypothetical protein
MYIMCINQIFFFYLRLEIVFSVAYGEVEKHSNVKVIILYLISTFSNYKLDFKKNEIYFTLYILSFYLYRFPSSEIIIFETCLTININTFFNWIQILIYHLVRVQPLQSDATPLVFIEKLFIILSFCI